MNNKEEILLDTGTNSVAGKSTYETEATESSLTTDEEITPKAKEKIKIAEIASGAAKLADRAKNAVVNAMDRNDDGKLDLNDLRIAVNRAREKQAKEKKEKEFNSLNPIFEDDITAPEFILTKMIRVADIDKKHANNEDCRGSIGYISGHKGVRIVTIYPVYTGLFGLNFYPNKDNEVYYVDPYNRDQYIALDEYFKYMRLVKVNELQMIAQALGARHFKVSYIEQKQNKTGEKAQIQAVKFLSGNHQEETNEFSKIEVAAEMECLGHEPVEPQLVYLKSDPNIQTMVKMRLARNAPVHQKVSLDLISSSGMKVNDAMKIDAALKALDIKIDISVSKEAQSEARTILEYEIDY